jgi:GntR family transcriptional regulator, transcriptional repressor for pyruvate dehydrogenase complex
VKASETFARELIDDIVRRGLGTGARLPTEAALVHDYGCSRQSVREGLRLLEVSGLVTMHRGVGGGPRLGRVDPGNLGRMATLFLHLAGATHDELFDALITAEALLAERSARNPDRAAVEAAMGPHLQHPDRAELSKADFIVEHTEFHATVAALAGNRVLSIFLQSITQIFTHHVLRTSDPRAGFASIENDHRLVAEAVLAGDPTGAREAMAAHEQRLIEGFRRSKDGDSAEFISWI